MRRNPKLVLASAGVCCSVFAFPAAAQEAAPEAETNDAALPGIVVTATKRETTLADTALTVSVVDGDAIADQGLVEITQIFNDVPGLGQVTTPGEQPAVKIRGIGTTAASQTLEQSVGLFLDGVYKPRARQYRDSLFDVERVEVIKGAQGVVFGKNTNVGAISITSRKPGDDFGGNLSASYETEFDSYVFQGGLDLPVSDIFKVRVSGLYSDTGGYVENQLTGETDGDQERYAVRGIAQLEPSDAFDATLLVQYSEQETAGSLFQLTESFIPGTSTPFVRLVDGPTNVGGTAFPGDNDEQNNFDAALTLNFALSDNVTLTSISSYSEFDFENSLDIFLLPASPGLSGFLRFQEEFDQFTQELRLDFDLGNTRILAGAFYQEQNLDFTTQVGLDFVIPPSTPPAFTDGFNAGGNFQSFLDQELTNYSGFIQITHDVSDRFTIEGGVRLAVEEKSGTFLRETLFTDNLGLIPFIPGVSTFPPGVPLSQLSLSPLTTPDIAPFTDEINDTTIDGSITLSYDIGDDLLLHLSASQGTKSGAFNNQVTATINPMTFGVDVFGFVIEPEVARSIELGLKGNFAGGRGYFATAIFYTDVEDFQESFFDASIPPVGALVAGNVDARSVGFEAEARFAVTSGITLSGTIAYLDAENTDAGSRLAVAPEFTSTWGVDVNESLTSDFDFLFGAQAFTNSGFLHVPTQLGATPIESGSFVLVDSYVGLTHTPSNITLRLDVRNLTDEVYTTFGSPGVIPGTVTGTFNRPRTLRFSLSTRF